MQTDPDAFTAVYLVSHDAHGHHFDFLRAGSAASRMQPQDLPRATIECARVLHLSAISLAISAQACDAGFAAIEIARAAGTLVSFDTNLRLKPWPLARARAVMTEALRLADIALPSCDDLATITGWTDPDRRLDHCLGLGAKTVALELGERGAIVAREGERHRLAPHPCRPVDATGAGDTFGGVFVARWLAGDPLHEAGRYGAAAAALSTEGFGAVEPIPRPEAGHAALAMASNKVMQRRPSSDTR